MALVEKIKYFLNKFRRNKSTDKEIIIREIGRKIDGVQFKIDLLTKRQLDFHAEDSRGFSQLTVFSKDIKTILDEQIKNNEAIKKTARVPFIKRGLITAVTKMADQNISGAIDAKLLMTIQEMHLRGETARPSKLEKLGIASHGPLFEHLKKLVEKGKLKKIKENKETVYIPAYAVVDVLAEESADVAQEEAVIVE
jgi:hypothetical protein